MSKQLAALMLAGGVALAPATASAESIEGRWSLTLQGGTDVELSGDVHGGGSGSVLGLPTSVEARKYDDIYGAGFRFHGSLGYGVSERVELFAAYGYYKMTADVLQVGNVAGLTLNADFKEYKEQTIEAGMRAYFGEDRFKPYVGLSAGVRMIDAIPPTFTVPEAGVTLDDVPFFDDSNVFTGAFALGFQQHVSDAVAIGVEAQLRYQGNLKEIEGLAGTGLESINDETSRWSVPLLATIAFRF